MSSVHHGDATAAAAVVVLGVGGACGRMDQITKYSLILLCTKTAVQVYQVLFVYSNTWSKTGSRRGSTYTSFSYLDSGGRKRPACRNSMFMRVATFTPSCGFYGKGGQPRGYGANGWMHASNSRRTWYHIAQTVKTSGIAA